MSLEGVPDRAEVGILSLAIEPLADPTDDGRLESPNRLMVQPDLPPASTVDTLWHELLHAMGTAHGIPLLRGDSKRTEDFILQLAPALTVFFRDNPALGMWMLKEAVRSRGV